MKDHLVEIQRVRPGEAGNLHLGIKWMPGVWAQREEMQLQSMADFIGGFCDRLMRLDRFEIAVYRVTDSGADLRAAAVVTFDEDAHVGYTLSIEVAYSADQGLGRLLMREFHKLAAQGGVKTLRLIKRTGAYSYNVRYAKVRE